MEGISQINETMQREWDDDQFADQVDDIIRDKSWPEEPLVNSLISLARRGSNVAAIFVSNVILFRDGAKYDKELSIELLEKGFDRGSVECGFQLARFYFMERIFCSSYEWLLRLSKCGYAPAQYLLGYYIGEGVVSLQGSPDVLTLMNNAAHGGHLFAQKWLLADRLESTRGVFKKISLKSKIICLSMEIEELKLSHPSSDRIRLWQKWDPKLLVESC